MCSGCAVGMVSRRSACARVCGWCPGDAPAASAPYDPQKDAVRLDPVKATEEVLKVRLYEALAPGSTTYTPSDLVVLVKARSVRVIDVQLEELRVSGRATVRAFH